MNATNILRGAMAAAPLLLMTLAAAPTAAGVLSNKLSASYDNIVPSNIFTLNNACGCDPTFSSAGIDSFTLGAKSHLTSIQAALIEINQNDASYSVPPHFGGFDQTQGYQVNIYSSAAAAAGNLTGDVYSKSFAPTDPFFAGSLTIAPGAGFAPFSAASTLATFGIDATLAAGTYWLGVISINDPDIVGQESIFIGTSGPGTAKLANPGGGWGVAFGMPGTLFDVGGKAGYAVSGTVPEPASWALLIGGFGLVGNAMRRRHPATVTA